MWVVILSMTTVGYGDLYPLSHLGRILTMAACLTGTIILSLLTITIMTKLSFSAEEETTFQEINTIKLWRELKMSAANLIR